MRNSRLFNAVAAFATEAAPSVAETIRSEQSPERIEWVADSIGDGQFFRRRAAVNRYGFFPIAWDIASSMESYRTVVHELHEDKVIRPQLGRVVGTLLGPRLVTEFDIVTDVLRGSLTKDLPLRLDLAAVPGSYRRIEAALYADSINTHLVAPLLGVELEGEAIVLSSSHSIGRMTPEATLLLLETGVLHHDDVSGLPFARNLPACGLFIEAPLSKVSWEWSDPIQAMERRKGRSPLPIEPTPPYPYCGHHSAELAKANDLLGPVSDALLALRLYREPPILAPGVVRVSDNWLYGGYQWDIGDTRAFQRPRWTLRPAYRLSPGDGPELQEIWSALHSERVHRRPSLNVALRRFMDAANRSEPEDQLIDLMIAAEALLLQDVGDPKDRGELRLRLALRAGRFIDSPELSPRAIFRLLRTAYDLRSTLVHGGKVKAVSLPGGERVGLSQFSRTVHAVIRLGLRKALNIAATSDGSLFEGEDTLLSDDPSVDGVVES